MYITGHEKLNKLAMYVDSYYTSFGDKAFVLSMNFAELQKVAEVAVWLKKELLERKIGGKKAK